MPTFFGQPKAENVWFGNELLIPPAELSQPLLPVPIPDTDPVPVPTPGYQSPGYQQYPQGGSGPNTGAGSAGNFSGYMTPATIDPATGLYENIGYDPNPSWGKVAAALSYPALGPLGSFAVNAVDKAFDPLGAIGLALGMTEASVSADDAASMAQDATGVDSGREATRQAASASLAANPMQAVAHGAGTFGGRKDQIGLDYDVETGSAGPDASSNPTVLCGALHSHGLLPDEVYRSDQEYGRELERNDPDVMRGYHAWASPIARLMRRCRTLSAVLSVLILPWAHEIHGSSNWLGRLYVRAGIPVCRWIGKRIRKRNRAVAA